MKMCSFIECDRPVGPKGARGLCPGHYQQHMAGKPLTPLQPRNVTEPWLMAHVDHNGDDCLTWPFQRLQNDGRAAVKFRGKQTVAYRVMCELAHGPAPSPDHEAAHSCGKGHEGCVNPKHLRWATSVENKADMLIHGTRVQGEKHPFSKLTADQVREARRLYGLVSGTELAARYGVSQTTMAKALRGASWRHV